MKGDFSRLTFRPRLHHARVLQQQGRPLLDADWNEQVAILLHRLQMLAGDLTGSTGHAWGAPVGLAGFEIRATGRQDDVEIGRGRYYVDGICVECEADTSLARQAFPPAPLSEPEGKPARGGVRLVFLDAWEAVVTALDDPHLAEPALAGLDTCLRTRIVWQVRMHPLQQAFNPKAPDWAALRDEGHALVGRWRDQPRGMLRIRLGGPAGDGRRQQAAPRAAYRGPENLLYRIEVHRGGPHGHARFKWSRENGAALLPLSALDGPVATVVPAARDAVGRLARGTWLEPSDRHDRLLGGSRDMAGVDTVEQAAGRIVFHAPLGQTEFRPGETALRRWDQREGGAEGIALAEGNGEAHWFDLEDGIQVQFEPSAGDPHQYRAGDYWLIPARTADEGTLLRGLAPQPPDGVDHVYAPLALFVPQSGEVIADYRPTFQPLAALQDQVNVLAEGLEELRGQVAALAKK